MPVDRFVHAERPLRIGDMGIQSIYRQLLLGIAIILPANSILVLWLGNDYAPTVAGFSLSILNMYLALISVLFMVTWPLAQPKRLPTTLAIFSFLSFPFLLYSVYSGFVNDLPAWRPYTVALLMSISVFFASFYANIADRDVAIFLHRIMWQFRFIATFTVTALILRLFGANFINIELGYYSYTATYIFSLGVVYELVKFLTDRKLTVARFIFLAAFVLALALQLEDKKIVVPAIVGSLAAVIALFASPYWRKIRLRAASVVVAFVILFGLVALWSPVLLGSYISDIWVARYNRPDEMGGLLGGRDVIWQYTWSLVEQKPFVGHGFGVGALVETRVAVRELSIHNTYLYFFAAIGAFGGLFLILALGTTLRLAHRSIRFSSEEISYVRSILFAHLLGFYILMFFDIFAAIQSAYLLGAMFAGVLVNFACRSQVRPKYSPARTS